MWATVVQSKEAGDKPPRYVAAGKRINFLRNETMCN
jgi:hypothetical protein